MSNGSLGRTGGAIRPCPSRPGPVRSPLLPELPPHPGATPRSRARARGRLQPRPSGSFTPPPFCRWPRPPGWRAQRRAPPRAGGR